MDDVELCGNAIAWWLRVHGPRNPVLAAGLREYFAYLAIAALGSQVQAPEFRQQLAASFEKIRSNPMPAFTEGLLSPKLG